ncbi:MAG: hypothetical protein GOMPHAMPRED_000206 [Gomphillus americanus]|uniref:Tetratricopeptide repeat protein 1 n=1 Tax=Gomphillus americanus TaxID=1940652 RepID=A0A8H3I197_9LECA|nr:MAG: hypothetical protein GOMPHAMPRED_000206 [Gomphillus americanus]
MAEQSSSEGTTGPDTPSPSPSPRFPPAEEAALLSTSNDLKAGANNLFAKSAFSDAISTYDQALASCPNYLEYEVAVLNSNIAACHLKLEQWKEAIASATKALDGLEREKTKLSRGSEGTAEGEGSVVEIEGDVEERLADLRMNDERQDKIEGLRAKSLLRRAKASVGQGGWSQLAAAETDYKTLATISILPPGDMKFVRQQLVYLPAKVKEAQEKEVGEMMGKLKDLGNGLLKPFGLSTDMFQFTKDDKTGGYNMSFGDKG